MIRDQKLGKTGNEQGRLRQEQERKNRKETINLSSANHTQPTTLTNNALFYVTDID